MILISLSILIAFFVSLYVAKWQIDTFREAEITGTDMHKQQKVDIPEMGGLSSIVGFIVGISLLLGERGHLNNPIFLTALIGIIGAGFIGMVDDLVALRQRTKAILPFLFSLPFGLQMMDGSIVFFNLTFSNPYLLMLIIPFGVTCAANASNMLEGFNGMGAGLSAIVATTLISLVYITGGPTYGLYLLFPLLGAVLGFATLNIYPSQIFPGDTFTLFTGAAIGSAAIICDLITPGVILFIPMIIEFFLKFKGGFQAENFADVDEDGYLMSVHDKTESITHWLVKKFKLKEWQLVALIWTVEGLLSITVLSYYLLM